ncbi:MAG: hypothetical protein H0W82_08425 [Actinobacteria bacterium]|nr:hypothetical protein [Actinomycetota bacterium]
MAEVYQNYSVIQSDISLLLRELAITFAAGLLILYAALMPIVRRASGELRRRNQQLHEQTAQLSVLLTREQATVEELRELNRLQDDFVAAASHELRTPLSPPSWATCARSNSRSSETIRPRGGSSSRRPRNRETGCSG